MDDNDSDSNNVLDGKPAPRDFTSNTLRLLMGGNMSMLPAGNPLPNSLFPDKELVYLDLHGMPKPLKGIDEMSEDKDRVLVRIYSDHPLFKHMGVDKTANGKHTTLVKQLSLLKLEPLADCLVMGARLKTKGPYAVPDEYAVLLTRDAFRKLTETMLERAIPLQDGAAFFALNPKEYDADLTQAAKNPKHPLRTLLQRAILHSKLKQKQLESYTQKAAKADNQQLAHLLQVIGHTLPKGEARDNSVLDQPLPEPLRELPNGQSTLYREIETLIMCDIVGAGHIEHHKPGDPPFGPEGRKYGKYDCIVWNGFERKLETVPAPGFQGSDDYYAITIDPNNPRLKQLGRMNLHPIEILDKTVRSQYNSIRDEQYKVIGLGHPASAASREPEIEKYVVLISKPAFQIMAGNILSKLADEEMGAYLTSAANVEDYRGMLRQERFGQDTTKIAEREPIKPLHPLVTVIRNILANADLSDGVLQQLSMDAANVHEEGWLIDTGDGKRTSENYSFRQLIDNYRVDKDTWAAGFSKLGAVKSADEGKGYPGR